MEINTGSKVNVYVNNIANAHTASSLIITNSELIDEVIDVGTYITQSTAVVSMLNSGNSYCSGVNMHRVDVTNGELVDNVIEFLGTAGSSINITAYDSANIFTVSSKTHILHAFKNHPQIVQHVHNTCFLLLLMLFFFPFYPSVT